MKLLPAQPPKVRPVYFLQALVVLAFALVYVVMESLHFAEAHLLLPGVVGGIYFLGLRIILHHLATSWVVASTLLIVVAVDFLIPVAVVGWRQTDWLTTASHLPLALMVASLEIFIEEEIELLDGRLE